MKRYLNDERETSERRAAGSPDYTKPYRRLRGRLYLGQLELYERSLAFARPRQSTVSRGLKHSIAIIPEIEWDPDIYSTSSTLAIFYRSRANTRYREI